MRKTIKNILAIFLCGVLFFGASYAYLHFNINKGATKAEQKNYDVPYKLLPENSGIAFVLPDNSAVITYLDFEKNRIDVVNVEKYDETNDLYYGYTADYKAEINYELIGGVIDRIGGINVEVEGEKLRYTGVQAIDLISENLNNDIKGQILTEIFKQISKNNFSKDDFIYIIENSKSDLSLLDCIYWLDYIDEMCQNINFIG